MLPLCLSVVGIEPHPTAAAPPVPLAVVVVAGQSNAIGYESYVRDPVTHDDVFTDATRSPADRQALLMWAETGVHTSGTAPVPLDTLQVLPGAPSAVFGPELGLARGLYAAGTHHLLIVKVAYTGTSLAKDWQPTRPDFQELVQRVHQALAWAVRHGDSPTIIAFCWMQGEADATRASWASHYAANLHAFIREVRQRLALPAATPFLLGQIDLSDYIAYEARHGLCTTPTCTSEREWNHEVMAAQAAAASADVFTTATSSLPRRHHFLHLTNQAELTLGSAFAALTIEHQPAS